MQQSADFGRVYLLDQNRPAFAGALLVTLDNHADRAVLRRRQTIQVSALSTFDGRVLAYLGDNG